MKIKEKWISAKQAGKKSLAVLVDPDGTKLGNFENTLHRANECGVDYFFVGGSLLLDDKLNDCIVQIKSNSNIPIVLFPGNGFQIHHKANALLLLSLISGRNAEYLIGKQVESALRLHDSGLEILATAYLLIDGGNSNSAAYLSQTLPIPADKTELALATSLAAQQLNFECLYLEAGSGAKKSVSKEMISEISSHLSMPILVGGGLRDAESVYEKLKHGADIAVVGNILEQHPEHIKEMMAAVRSFDAKKIKTEQ